jgi:hypothetical protein
VTSACLTPNHDDDDDEEEEEDEKGRRRKKNRGGKKKGMHDITFIIGKLNFTIGEGFQIVPPCPAGKYRLGAM